jgi:hypothetical protein
LTSSTTSTGGLPSVVVSSAVGLPSVVVSSAVGLLSLGDASVVVSGLRSEASAGADRFGGSAFSAFGASAELSELGLLPEGDGSSAWATPLPNPTTTQADSKKAATISRNHQ